MTQSVLVVAAHPDDELLGCGGTLARHVLAGDRVNILILGEGTTSRGATASVSVAELRSAGNAAAKIIGAQQPRFIGLPDNKLDGLPLLDVIRHVEPVIAELRPSIVYTHHGGDLNKDHRIVFQAALTACRPQMGSTVHSIYTYETVSSTEWSAPSIDETGFRPTRFVDVEKFLDLKLKALACYGSEMRPFPHPRSPESLRALAMWRGAAVGLRAAEAFVVIREIDT